MRGSMRDMVNQTKWRGTMIALWIASLMFSIVVAQLAVWAIRNGALHEDEDEAL